MLSLIPYNEQDYHLLCEKITAEKVRKHLEGIVEGEVIRYELPNISALQFVCYNAMRGGVTTSLSIDTHGKSLSYALLEMEVDV
jgi:non-ribosomal peptide synthetase component E (peptide arylation enzyme)